MDGGLKIEGPDACRIGPKTYARHFVLWCTEHVMRRNLTVNVNEPIATKPIVAGITLSAVDVFGDSLRRLIGPAPVVVEKLDTVPTLVGNQED